MPVSSNPVLVRNRILLMMARTEYWHLHPKLEQVALPAKAVLYAPGDLVKYIYFPNDAVVSLLIHVDERRTVEVAMEGNEGVVGLGVGLSGARSCNLSIVRDAGTAMRLDVNALTKCANERGRLPGLLCKSVYALVMQIAQSGVCSRFHSVDPGPKQVEFGLLFLLWDYQAPVRQLSQMTQRRDRCRPLFSNRLTI